MIVYYPEGEEGMGVLKKSAADIHIQAIHKRIAELPCAAEQKMALYQAVLEELQSKSEPP
jgi:hypothetical protein